MRTRIYNKLTAYEITQYLEHGDTIYLPVGVVECHDPYPVDCETVIPQAFATILAEKTDGLVLEGLEYFFAGGTAISTATVHISIRDGIDFLYNVCSSLVNQGFRKLIFVSAHMPAHLTLDAFIRDFFEETLIHPCHINLISAMMGLKKDVKTENDLADIFDRMVCGSYKIMHQEEYLPVDLTGEMSPRHKDPDPALTRFENANKKNGGCTSLLYSCSNEHCGGKVFSSEAERSNYCKESEITVREIANSIDIQELLDSLDEYQAYAQTVAQKNPHILNL